MVASDTTHVSCSCWRALQWRRVGRYSKDGCSHASTWLLLQSSMVKERMKYEKDGCPIYTCTLLMPDRSMMQERRYEKDARTLPTLVSY